MMMKRKTIFSLFMVFMYLASFSQTRVTTSSDKHLQDTGIVSKDSLLKIIKQQNDDIAAFKSLQEELTAKEVFDKSKSYLISWITIGGMAILFVILFGYFKIKDYIIDELKGKMDKEGTQVIQNESSKQIELYIKSNLHIDEIAREIESKGNEKLNELMNANKRSFDEFVEKKQKDFQDFLRQLEESRQTLKGPLGEGLHEEKVDFDKPALTAVDYAPVMNPVRDQDQLGSSVGFAMAYTMEYFIKKQLNKKIVLSPLFIYYHARKMDGNEKTDAGATIQNVIKVAREHGVVSEESWPYKIAKFAVAPPKSVDKEPHYFVVDVDLVKNQKQIKSALSDYGPVVIGISIYSSFYNETSGIIKMPARKETIIGGHAISLVGFDDKTQLFKFKNSWGQKWGDKGYGYLPYDYIEKFSADGWIIKSVKENNSGT